MPRLTHATEQGRETLKALRTALMELILEKGLDQVTVKDITERAGVDRTTFYLHARDKRELFEVSQRQMIDELFAGGEEGADLRARTVLGFRTMAAHAAAYRALLAAADVATDRRLHEHLADHIEQIIRVRIAQAELPPDLIAAYVASAIRGLGRWWLEHDMPYQPETMADIFQRLLAGGFSAFDHTATKEP